MTDNRLRKYKLSDIIIDKEIDNSFKCGICMGILNTPILCGGGHSWCLDCIKTNNKKKCPLCPKSIDSDNPAINISLQSLIGTIICKCPNGAQNLISEEEDHNNKKRKNNSSSAFSKETGEEDSCSWTGRYDQFENHIKNCFFISTPCTFVAHGCKFDGTKNQLDEHYENSSHVHNMMLSNEIISLKSSKIVDQSSISKLKQTLLNAENELSKKD